MARRRHIIYAHPADTDGYVYFYLCYYPGGESLTLRYGTEDDRREEVTRTPVAMLDWVDGMARSPEITVEARRPWERSAKALRIRLRQWLESAEQ